jgi:hypothetical protein
MFSDCTLAVLCLCPDYAPIIRYEEKESMKDYAELVVQYGFVTLFVVAYPLVPALGVCPYAICPFTNAPIHHVQCRQYPLSLIPQSPLTPPTLALFNNIFEPHIDAYKLCSSTRRATPHMTDTIGLWGTFMAIQSNLAVLTNLGLILFTSSIVEEWSSTKKLATFLICEHLMMFVKWVISELVPDEPGYVTG